MRHLLAGGGLALVALPGAEPRTALAVLIGAVLALVVEHVEQRRTAEPTGHPASEIARAASIISARHLSATEAREKMDLPEPLLEEAIERVEGRSA
jgi:predicted outer membrane lipoprotein